ncbi:MAG: cytochrome c4 [Gammaproteobacteria bacterium]|nr:cytochrome c4 [Gammaproteobacteria bacterium]
MNYKRRLQGIMIAGSVALAGPVFAETPSAAMLGNTCAGCHGTHGNSQGPATPTIAGVSSEYFIDAMMGYKNGDRAATIMDRIAKGYTDEEIKLMAEFFSTQKMERPEQKVDAALAKKGMKMHEKYCEKCHADGGRSTEDDAGMLAGQWTPYLHFTMSDFMSGKREMPKKMKKKVEELQAKGGDAAIEALIHYYGSQK